MIMVQMRSRMMQISGEFLIPLVFKVFYNACFAFSKITTFVGMKLKRPNKTLEAQIKAEVQKLTCPVHRKQAHISMDDEESEVFVTEACCPFFKKDVFNLGERIRKGFLLRDEKRREREERERKRNLRND